MRLEHIKESGLLELYVLGELSARDQNMIEEAILKFPDLKKEIYEIEHAFQNVAQSHAVETPDGILNNILKDIGSNAQTSNPPNKKVTSSEAVSEEKISKSSKRNFLSSILFSILALGLAGMLWAQFNKNTGLQENYRVLKNECDSLANDANTQFALLQEIHNKDNSIIKVDPTEGFPETKLYIHNNDVSDKNYLQVFNLPKLEDNQSFQLWSLREGQDPRPLNVFQADIASIFEVDHVDQTNAYAITIEPLGGKDTPTLTNLIGVFTM